MVSKLPIRRVHTGNRVADEAQRTAQDAARQLNQSVLSGGLLIESQTFIGGTPQSIAHGLGRRAKGWIEVYGADAPSAANVGLFTSAHPSGISSSTHVTVTPTNSGTCSLFVY